MTELLLVLSLPIVWELAGMVAAVLLACWVANRLDERRMERDPFGELGRRAGRKQRSTQ